MRIWMVDIPQYMPPVALGEVMRAFGFAEIVESRHRNFKKGDKIVDLTGLQDYVVIGSGDLRTFQKVPTIPFLSDASFLGTLGINGLTAYFGLLELAKRRNTGCFRCCWCYRQYRRSTWQVAWLLRCGNRGHRRKVSLDQGRSRLGRRHQLQRSSLEGSSQIRYSERRRYQLRKCRRRSHGSGNEPHECPRPLRSLRPHFQLRQRRSRAL